jgi:hypothetical protein
MTNLNTLHECWNCGSRDLEWSCGAMFHSLSIFCIHCGCQGKTSETNPSDIESKNAILEQQAIDNWEKGLLQKKCYKHLDYS